LGDIIRVGLVQVSSSENKEESMYKIRKLLERSRVEADLLVFPEYLMADPTGLGLEGVKASAEGLSGSWFKFFSKIAAEYGSCTVFNMFEQSGRPKPYNSTVIVSPRGEALLVYRKTHLFDALGYRESSIFEPGDVIPEPVNCNGWRVAVSVCFELRFPEIFRVHGARRADLVVVPAAWYKGDGKEEALRVLAQARAHENGYYVAVSALYGELFTGRSIIVNPFGVVEVDAGWGDRYVEHVALRSLVEEARRKYPLLELRRTDIYASLSRILTGIFQ